MFGKISKIHVWKIPECPRKMPVKKSYLSTKNVSANIPPKTSDNVNKPTKIAKSVNNPPKTSENLNKSLTTFENMIRVNVSHSVLVAGGETISKSFWEKSIRFTSIN